MFKLNRKILWKIFLGYETGEYYQSQMIFLLNVEKKPQYSSTGVFYKIYSTVLLVTCEDVD